MRLIQYISLYFQYGGIVALSVEYRTCDQEVVGSSLSRAQGVKTVAMFFTPMCLCHQAVQVGTGQRAVMPCGWGVRAGMVCLWVAGKTVWSPCYTRPYLSALEVRHDEALYKSTFTLLYLHPGTCTLHRYFLPVVVLEILLSVDVLWSCLWLLAYCLMRVYYHADVTVVVMLL